MSSAPAQCPGAVTRGTASPRERGRVPSLLCSGMLGRVLRPLGVTAAPEEVTRKCPHALLTSGPSELMFSLAGKTGGRRRVQGGSSSSPHRLLWGVELLPGCRGRAHSRGKPPPPPLRPRGLVACQGSG